MELRHMRYFVAIAEERSFTRAAERLWVAQPGLSTQIRRLESELGVQLFERHTRGVDLTDAGELFLERARTALAAADAARSTGHDLEEGLVGSVRLGIATGAGWPGPAMLAAVTAGEALALTTTPYAAVSPVTARAIHPVRRVEFALLWRDETPTSAFNELIRCAEARAGAPRRMLAAVA